MRRRFLSPIPSNSLWISALFPMVSDGFAPFLTAFQWHSLDFWVRSVEGKHVLITGGSQGLGLALAKLCHQQGASVTIVARTKKTLEWPGDRNAAHTHITCIYPICYMNLYD